MGVARERRAFVALPALCALIGAWTIVAMNLFSTLTEKWLAFASGVGILSVAVVALTRHDLSVERVVHSLEVTERTPARERRSASPVDAEPNDIPPVRQHA